MWVVKLGGSIADYACLTHWLKTLSQTDTVIVPGGGSFADAVRKAQGRWHFDDVTAHHMAILAMQQYGRMLVGLCPQLIAATNLEDLANQPNQAKVWLPNHATLDEAGIPASWDITSDSLAAWLAGQIHAKHLLLVKSLAVLDDTADQACQMTITQAVEAGWIDSSFSQYAVHQPFQSWLCGPAGYAKLPRGFTEPASVFTWLRQ